jgi:hypothetical protein
MKAAQGVEESLSASIFWNWDARTMIVSIAAEIERKEDEVCGATIVL